MKYIVGAVAAFAIAGLIGLAVVLTGTFDISATTPHSRLVAWGLHATMLRWVEVHSPRSETPPAFTAQQVDAGFRDYDVACVACHGGPGVNRAEWVKGLNPTPPYLLDVTTRLSPAELHTILHRGVKMTAMPAWGATRTDAQLWDLVAFLEAMPSLTPADYARMRCRARGAPTDCRP
jgi:mono/diheme cytochrome c family protein